MCKTNMKMDLYYLDICKQEHGKKKKRLWCKIVAKISVKQIEGNKGFYLYLYPFEDLVQGSFYVCIK